MSVLVSFLLTLRDTGRSRASLQLEVLALRHQLQVVQRSRAHRFRLTCVDRLLWAWFAPGVAAVARRTRHRQTGDGHHLAATIAPEVRTLIRTMSYANPLWGAPRIHG
jgi:hypothetical protein